MISFRKVTEKDTIFIESVYRSTREQELSMTNWSEMQKKAFVMMQLSAQLHHYANHFPGSTHVIINYKQKPVGRLYTCLEKEAIRILDISLLPVFRNKGIGNLVILGIIKEAKKAGIKVALHVMPDNPALHLYERIGFVRLTNQSGRIYMEHQAGTKK